MGLLPEKIKHIAQAAALLGHIDREKILQLGESIASVRNPFSVLHQFRHLREDASGPIWTQNCL